MFRTPTKPNPSQDGVNPHAPYYPALDGLRAIAVLGVFLGHYAHFLPGGWGVDIFFVLSGFLITGILYDARDTPHRFRKFYLRRMLRIFPAYYTLWLLLLVLTPVLGIAWRPANLLWPAYLGNWIGLLSPGSSNQLLANPFILNTGHFWTLCIEEQFYLLWPLVVFKIRKRSTLLLICAVTIVVSPVLRIVLGQLLSPPHFLALNGATFLRFDEFLVGGLAALMLRGDNPAAIHRAAPHLFWAGSAATAVAALCALSIFGSHPGGATVRNWGMFVGITTIDITALGIILLCLDQHTWLGKLLSFKPLRGLGKISYGFYLWHEVPHAAYEHVIRAAHLAPRRLGLLIPFTGTLILALASYYLVERPFLKLKTRFDA